MAVAAWRSGSLEADLPGIKCLGCGVFLILLASAKCDAISSSRSVRCEFDPFPPPRLRRRAIAREDSASRAPSNRCDVVKPKALAQIVELLRCIYRVHLLLFAKSAVSMPVSIALFGASFAFVGKS